MHSRAEDHPLRRHVAAVERSGPALAGGGILSLSVPDGLAQRRVLRPVDGEGEYGVDEGEADGEGDRPKGEKDQRLETRDQRPETRDQVLETRDNSQETKDHRLETRDGGLETGDGGAEGSREQETAGSGRNCNLYPGTFTLKPVP